MNCQGLLTYGQIYNYDVGDVLQTELIRICGTASSYEYSRTTFTITGKTQNATSVTYTFFESTSTKTCYLCGPDPTVTISYPLTFIMTDTIRSCYYAPGTLFKSVSFDQTCGRSTEKLYFNDSPLTEPTSETDLYIAGVGGPFFEYNTAKNVKCHSIEKRFLYCFKQNGSSCPLDLHVNDQIGLKQEFMVFPVPSKDIVQIRTTIKLVHYDIIDFRGSVYLHGTVTDNSINIENLKRGEYICAFQTDHGTITARIVKE